ncbi:Microtubule-associated protein 1A [Linum grandiflorum]
MSWDMCSDTHFLDNLGNRNSISVCVVKRNWDAYSEQNPWGNDFVAHLSLSGQLNIHGVVIRGQKLKDLYNDLYKYQCRVNRDGFSVFYISSTVKYKRLNDMFPWYKYGVQPKFNTVWDRLEMSNDKITLLGSQKAELEALKNKVSVLNQQIRDKDMVLKQKDDELIKKGEMVVARDKIVKEQEEELSKKDEIIVAKDKVVKEKEEELKKKDKTIQVLKNTVNALA